MLVLVLLVQLPISIDSHQTQALSQMTDSAELASAHSLTASLHMLHSR